MANDRDYGAILKTGFDRILTAKYGACIPPASYTTSTGIRTLDAIIGGGFTSSAPIAFSSTPETGKSTIALQLSSMFLNLNPDSAVCYIDTESASNDKTPDIEDRIVTFGIPRERFLYKAMMLDVFQVFEAIKSLIGVKKEMEEKTKREYKVMVILDSIAAVSSSKDAEADDVNKTIGFKARELTFQLSKCKQDLAMNRVVFVVIDQIRANMQIQSKFQTADEKGVGTFGNYKSATNVSSLQHNFRQWFWLSKGKVLSPTDSLRVDGWIINLYTEKNKLKSSKYSIPLVFDKKFGAIPLLSEYWFLSNKTQTEKKFWPDPKKLRYPMAILGVDKKKVLEVINPETGEVEFRSSGFSESKLIEIYNSDEKFRFWFDKAVQYSIDQRINVALFRESLPCAPEAIDPDEEILDMGILGQEVEIQYDPETGAPFEVSTE